ncbi:hypothetical protein H6P81_000001 [Aristolochia fimbriata]|uniref:Uncharacterized protein n=1 Tax=Aristolochia fimbriata TaxID=158543 RepID=A0AAV7F7F3_ARIFI|nr:hypothetical protein H6P81_000001 [Aristolochia fimbriata]
MIEYALFISTKWAELRSQCQKYLPCSVVFDGFSCIAGNEWFCCGVISLFFFGIITSSKYFLIPKILITFVMAIGIILTPIYSLSMLRQMFYGYKLFNITNSYFFWILDHENYLFRPVSFYL